MAAHRKGTLFFNMPAVHSFNVCIFESEKKATRVAHACLTIYRLPSYFFEKKFCSRLAVKSKPRLSKPVQTFHDTFRIPTYRSGDIEIELFARMKSFDVSTLWFFFVRRKQSLEAKRRCSKPSEGELRKGPCRLVWFLRRRKVWPMQCGLESKKASVLSETTSGLRTLLVWRRRRQVKKAFDCSLKYSSSVTKMIMDHLGSYIRI